MVEVVVVKNIEVGEVYLVENVKCDGVIVIEFGLQYEVLEEGEGVSLLVEDEVKVYYCGMFLDGIEFDLFYVCNEFV